MSGVTLRLLQIGGLGGLIALLPRDLDAPVAILAIMGLIDRLYWFNHDGISILPKGRAA